MSETERAKQAKTPEVKEVKRWRWMTRIGLKSVYELSVFSLVYEYESRNLEYSESLGLAAKWAVCSTRTTMRAFAALVERGYLNKETRVERGSVKRCVYTVNTDKVLSALEAIRKVDSAEEGDTQRWIL